MASNKSRLLAFIFVAVLPLSLARIRLPLSTNPTPNSGPLANGTLNLSLLWYGAFENVQKDLLKDFVESLNGNGTEGVEMKVSSWWRVVGNSLSDGKEETDAKKQKQENCRPKIQVKIVSNTDMKYEFGKFIKSDSYDKLIEKATRGNSNTVAVVFFSNVVRVDSFCVTSCQKHGISDNKKPYIFVSNPETACPGVCAWPFHKTAYGPRGMVYQPPNEDVGADAMVIQLAAALANLVTDPLISGYTAPASSNSLNEIASVCKGTFGSGAFPGYSGKVRIDPYTGGAFNAHGNKKKKFLLPAIWDVQTASCWTPM